MARRKQQEAEPPIRKSFLIFGGVAVGVALIAFILMNFVLKGSGGGAPIGPAVSPAAITQPSGAVAQTAPVHTAAPAATPQEVTPGGRDPFSP